MLGFVENFNHNKFCRFCSNDRNKIDKVFIENQCKLQTDKDYNSGVLKDDVNSTGIAAKCIFTCISGFHPMNNLAVDVLHDLLKRV